MSRFTTTLPTRASSARSALDGEAAHAADPMLAQPSLIKRPVAEWAGVGVSVDVDAAAWAALLERQ